MTLALTLPLLLWLLPLAALPLLPGRPAALPLPSLQPLERLPPSWRCRLAALQPWLAAGTLALVVLALAGPVERQHSRQTVRSGVDLMLALDISASLAARDIPPDRMTAARTAAAEFVAGREGDRVGVILFAGVPYLLSPPVLDKGPLLARLRQVEADRLGSGTAIGDAVAAALDRLKDSSAKSRAVVLLTDGSSNRGRITPLAAARAAAALGVRLYTIGFGSDAGAPLPLGPNGAPARLADGSLLQSALEQEPLRELARLTGGSYFRADSDRTLREVYRQIDALGKSPLEIRETVSDSPLRPPLLRLAALLVAMELLLFRGWLRQRNQPLCWTDLGALLALCLLFWASLPAPAAPAAGTAAGTAAGPALALAVDVSASMAATDLAPTRLEQAVAEIRTLAQGLPQARFALLPFAGEATLQLPLSADREALDFFLARLSPGLLAAPGSAPEEAALAALASLDGVPGERAVLLFSDGERTRPGPPPALPGGVPIYVIPLGTTTGAPLTDRSGQPRWDRDGQRVVSRADPQRLARIAEATGGTVLTRQGRQPAVAPLLDRWGRQETATTTVQPGIGGLAVALGLLLLRPLARLRRQPRLAAVAASALLLLAASACRPPPPPPGAALFTQAVASQQQGQTEAAVQGFARAAELLEGAARAAALFNQGTLRLTQGQYQLALAPLEQALLLLPGDEAVRTNLILTLRGLGDQTPPGLGAGEEQQPSVGGAGLSREQALQLLQAVHPEPGAPQTSAARMGETAGSRDW